MSPQEDTPEVRENFAVLKLLQQAINQDPSIKDRIVNAIAGKPMADETVEQRLKKLRPLGPYYREKYALQLKPILDQMMKDGKDKVVKYEHHQGIKHKTLWQRIYQSISYLCDHLDTKDGDYSIFKLTLSIEQCEHGILLKQDKNIDTHSPLVASTLDEEATKDIRWRDKLTDFLENADPGDTGTKFVEDNAVLSDEDVAKLREELSLIKGIISNVTNSTISVVKLPYSAIQAQEL